MGLKLRALGSLLLALSACEGEDRPEGRLLPPSHEPIPDAAPVDALVDASMLPDASFDAEVAPSDPDAASDAAPSTDAGTPEPVVCEPLEDFLIAPEEGRLLAAHAAPVGDGFAVAYAIREGELNVVRAALLDPCGGVVAEALPVDETGRFIAGARVAGLGDGFVVAWTRADGDPTDAGVVFRRFDADGRGRGAIITANVTEPRLQLLAAAAPLPDGFAVAWVDHSAADFDARPDVLMRSFDAEGEPRTDEVSLSPSLDAAQDLPGLAADGGGAIVAAYHVGSLSPQVRRMTADGDWLDEEPIVLSQERKEVTDVAMGPTHTAFAMVSRAVEDRGDVEVAVMDAATAELVIVSVAAAPGVDEVDARVAALPDGAFLLAWTDESHIEDEHAEGVLAVRVRPDGSLDGERFVIPTETAGDQILQSLAVGPGGVLAVWIDHSQADGHDGAALRARLLVHEVAEVAQ